MVSLKSIMTLLDTQELAAVEVSAKIELKTITPNSASAYKKAELSLRSLAKSSSTICPVISGMALSRAVANIIITEVNMSLPMCGFK